MFSAMFKNYLDLLSRFLLIKSLIHHNRCKNKIWTDWPFEKTFE